MRTQSINQSINQPKSEKHLGYQRNVSMEVTITYQYKLRPEKGNVPVWARLVC